MKFLGKIIEFFAAEMEKPTNFGWFHLMFIALAIIATVLICIFLKNAKEKTFRTILFACWAVMFCFEIYKQLIGSFTYDAENNKIVFDYVWRTFPFQLCSTPLYILPFIVFLPKGRVRDAMMAFMAFFSLFGGLGVFAYPGNVFVETIGINIQTMVHHGLQVVLGIYIAVYTRKKLGMMYYLKGAIVFAVLLLIALVLNTIGYYGLVAAGADMELSKNRFNMFYVGPFHKCQELPILADIHPIVGPVWFILIYLVGFLGIGMLIFGIIIGIVSLVHLIKKAGKRSCGA